MTLQHGPVISPAFADAAVHVRVIGELQAALGDKVVTEIGPLLERSHDSSVPALLREARGDRVDLPVAAVEAGNREDVRTVLDYSRREDIPVVTRGGGSGVVGGLDAPGGSIILCMRGMDGIEVDADNLTARCGAGVMGGHLKRVLEGYGLTTGHAPQSIDISSVGGWVATGAAGQFSTRYGGIEQMILGLRGVMADGSLFETRPSPRHAAGPSLLRLLVGSEGVFGVVTEATLALRRLPEMRTVQSFSFAGMSDGLRAVREMLQAGLVPPVVRLYDPSDAAWAFRDCPHYTGSRDLKGRALLLLVHEGPDTAMCVAERRAAAKRCREAGGRDAGAAPVNYWLENCNHVPSLRKMMKEQGIIADTVEVSVPWSRADELYARLMSKLSGLRADHAAVHASHSYPTGTCFYVTFGKQGFGKDYDGMQAFHEQAWAGIMETTLDAGGHISHHHGIGNLRRAYLEREIGPEALEHLHRLVDLYNPRRLLNGHVLLPDRPDLSPGSAPDPAPGLIV